MEMSGPSHSKTSHSKFFFFLGYDFPHGDVCHGVVGTQYVYAVVNFMKNKIDTT